MRNDRKLDHDQVQAIRRSHLPNKSLARDYGVDPVTIRRIRNRETYKNVPENPQIPPDAGRRFDGKYETGDVVKLLGEVPVGYAETILTMPPHLDARPGEHVRRERRIIEECLRIAGAFGVVMYIRRPQFADDGVIDLGMDILEGLPLREVIIWTWGWRSVRRSPGDPTLARRRCPIRHDYASIHVLSGELWTVPEINVSNLRSRGSVWHFPLPPSTDVPPEFPLKLAQWCIALGRGRVLDPFAGTGTTALAAEAYGRHWTLFDETDAHCDRFARRRVDELHPQPFL